MPTLMSAIAQPSFTGITAQAIIASDEGQHRRHQEQQRFAARRDDRLLHHHLERVGEGLQQAERADHVRPFAQLHRRQDLALGIGQVGDADQQRHQQRQRLRSTVSTTWPRGCCSRGSSAIAPTPPPCAGAASTRGALRHGRAGAADRIGLVVVGRSAAANGASLSAAGSPAGPVRSVQPKRGRKPTRPNTGFTCSSRPRSASRSSYGSGWPTTWLNARRIFQSSRASPGG